MLIFLGWNFSPLRAFGLWSAVFSVQDTRYGGGFNFPDTA
jgi:hypothetical protein